ncbi:MAG: heme exporter protein CcmB [Gammaproteobacteria bacterium]|nr:heme exporter protein CcmB [Gammaproteobacteria bacterium]
MTPSAGSDPSLWVLFRGQLRRDLKLAFGQPSELANPLAFFVVVITLFPLGVSPEPGVLAGMAPGVLWIAALLATLLGLEALFRRDRDDGTLEQMVLRAQPLYLPVVARMLAHWMVTGAPLTLLAPLLGGMLNLAPEARLPLMLGLALGTPVLVLLGGVGAALTVGLRTGGVLLALLVLPLFVPVLILGVSAAELASSGLDPTGPLLWLAAGASFAITTVPFAIAAALRIGVETG